jgi:hypothetical protein
MDARAQVSLAADAFASLPQRWRMVLWHTEMEGETPAQVAPLLGMTPNSVSALAYRARKRLRKTYLDHDVSVEARACRSSSVQPCGPGAQVRRSNARVAAGDRVLDPPSVARADETV